mmetsp:Transcript_7375/g.27561  ORF Transcript_7375/g.27561 Transcript_7375/m.27561 type:complete len:82 (-) Transcript_7375:1194-1439(-)
MRRKDGFEFFSVTWLKSAFFVDHVPTIPIIISALTDEVIISGNGPYSIHAETPPMESFFTRMRLMLTFRSSIALSNTSYRG